MILKLIDTINRGIKPDTIRHCNAAVVGSKPGKMQRTAKQKAAGKPEKLNQRRQLKNIRKAWIL